MIYRLVSNQIEDVLFKGKAILLFGARQTGKTTLLKSLASQLNYPCKFYSGDDSILVNYLASPSTQNIKDLIGKEKLIFIDEAQRIPKIGLCIKIAVDNFPDVQIIATGSSSFELANKTSEPLTGRKYEFNLYPISYPEMLEYSSSFEEQQMLEKRLIYGSYPEIITHPHEEKTLLNLLVESYLYKDLLQYDGIQKSFLLTKILKALALQLGSEVSYNEIAQLVGADKNTVEKYIDLMEKAFIVYTLHGLHRNVRNELKKTKKIYFFDNGVRNSIIGNFQGVNERTDVGALWENYLIAERLKLFKYNGLYGGQYFWRTTQQQEIDYVEERDGKFYVFEFKWNERKKAKIPRTFLDHYPNTTSRIISRSNYAEFIGSIED